MGLEGSDDIAVALIQAGAGEADPARDAAELGERVRRLRVAAGLSQTQLAAGRFSKEYVSQIERGKTRPTADTLQSQSNSTLNSTRGQETLNRLRNGAQYEDRFASAESGAGEWESNDDALADEARQSPWIRPAIGAIYHARVDPTRN